MSGDIILCATMKLPAGWHCVLDPYILLWERLLTFFLLKRENLQPACRCPQMAGVGKREWVAGPLLPIGTDNQIGQWLCDPPQKWLEMLLAQGAGVRTFGHWSVAGQHESVLHSWGLVQSGLVFSVISHQLF